MNASFNGEFPSVDLGKGCAQPTKTNWSKLDTSG